MLSLQISLNRGCPWSPGDYTNFFQASMIENGIQSGKIFTYQERLKETESNNAELRKKLRHFSKGDSLSKSPLVKLEQKTINNA